MKDRVNTTSRLTARIGEIPVDYVYTVGVAWEPFFREIMERERLLSARCPECDITYLPPHLYCERCFNELETAVPVAARGVIHTFTIVTVDIDDKPLPEPQIWGFIEIDDTDGGLVHRVLCDPADVYIGMPVEAAFRPESEREGSILDITGFQPA